MRLLGLGVALLLGACEEAAPASCADWLNCYDLCNPWAYENPSVAITMCEQECREEVGFAVEDPSPSFDTPSVELTGVWSGIVLTELQAAHLIYADELPDYALAGRRLEKNLLQRASCVRP